MLDSKRGRDYESVEELLEERLLKARPLSSLLSLDALFKLGRSGSTAGADAGEEEWSLHGWFGRSEQYLFFANFKAVSLPYNSNQDVEDSSVMLSRMCCVEFVFIDTAMKKYYRFSELDQRGSVVLLAVMAERAGFFQENNCVGEAVVEQLHINNMILPDRCANTGASSASGVVDVQYGSSSFKCIRQKGGLMTFEMHLRGQTNDSHEVDNQVKIAIDATFVSKGSPILDGEDGVVPYGSWELNAFRYFVPSCRVTKAEIRMSRASDSKVFLDERFGHGTVWLEHELRRVRANSLQISRLLRELSYKATNNLHYHERCCLTVFDVVELQISATRFVNSMNGETTHAHGLVKMADQAKPDVFQVTFHQDRTKQYRSTTTGILYSTAWKLTLKNEPTETTIELLLAAALEEQEFVSVLANPSFWKGYVNASGSVTTKGKPPREVSGIGFLGVYGKRNTTDSNRFFDLIRTAGIVPLETHCKPSDVPKNFQDTAASQPVLSGVSSVAVVLGMQGIRVTDTHKVLLSTLLATYISVYHRHSREEVVEALDWCYNKWMSFTSLSSVDYFTVLIRAFMLRELRSLLETKCSGLLRRTRTPIASLDLVCPIYLGWMSSSEAPSFPSPLPVFGSPISDLDAAVASASFRGEWKEEKALRKGFLRNLFLHEGAPLFLRYHQSLLNFHLSLDFLSDSTVFVLKQTAFMLNYTVELPLDTTEATWECIGRGMLKSRAALLPNGKGIFVETTMSTGVEKVWFTHSANGKCMQESVFFFSTPTEEKPTSWIVRTYQLQAKN